jgi:hypothetical protein
MSLKESSSLAFRLSRQSDFCHVDIWVCRSVMGCFVSKHADPATCPLSIKHVHGFVLPIAPHRGTVYAR